jgi:hypothetical protein
MNHIDDIIDEMFSEIIEDIEGMHRISYIGKNKAALILYDHRLLIGFNEILYKHRSIPKANKYNNKIININNINNIVYYKITTVDKESARREKQFEEIMFEELFF